MENNTLKTTASYLAFLRHQEIDKKNFPGMLALAKEEDHLYKAANVEVEQVSLLTPFGGGMCRKKALAAIDQGHHDFWLKVSAALDEYDHTRDEVTREWRRLLIELPADSTPKDNLPVFLNGVGQFASRYGDWIWTVPIRHDPLNEFSMPWTNIRALQHTPTHSWYPHLEDHTWNPLPFPAKLLLLNEICGFVAITNKILEKTHGYKWAPPEELRLMRKSF